MTDKTKSLLKKAMAKGTLIRFRRRFERYLIRGYVVGVGPEFFLFALVSDRLYFDGFECFRIKDVHKLELDPHARFVKCALRKRRERAPNKSRIDLRDIQRILVSASRAFPIVTIQREKFDPHICRIGRILEVQGRYVLMLEINPDAIWDAKPNSYPLREITRVNFGGDYENALYLVAGEPPPRTISKVNAVQKTKVNPWKKQNKKKLVRDH